MEQQTNRVRPANNQSKLDPQAATTKSTLQTTPRESKTRTRQATRTKQNQNGANGADVNMTLQEAKSTLLKIVRWTLTQIVKLSNWIIHQIDKERGNKQ